MGVPDGVLNRASHGQSLGSGFEGGDIADVGPRPRVEVGCWVSDRDAGVGDPPHDGRLYWRQIGDVDFGVGCLRRGWVVWLGDRRARRGTWRGRRLRVLVN